MSFFDAATALCALLFTYAVHSTVMIGCAWLFLSAGHGRLSAGLRLQLWKLAIVAPLFTATSVTSLQLPHLGFNVPFVEVDESRHRSNVTTLKSGSLPDLQQDLESRSSEVLNGTPRDIGVLAATEAIRGNAAADSMVSHRQGIPDLRRSGFGLVSAIWLCITLFGLVRLVREWKQVQLLRRNASPIAQLSLQSSLGRICRLLGIARKVSLLASTQVAGPLTAGIRQPFIIFPAAFLSKQRQFTPEEMDAILAHELAHVAHRDAGWNLLCQVVCRVGFFQPLNFIAVKAIRQEMDFVADSTAGLVLGERVALAKCLVRIVESRLGQARAAHIPALTSGMAVFESTLGQRIEMLLDDHRCLSPPSKQVRFLFAVCVTACALLLAMTSPRAVRQVSPSHDVYSPSKMTERVDTMQKQIASLIMATGLVLPATADDGPGSEKPARPAAVSTTKETAPLKTTPDELPEGIRGFNGMLVGRMAAKDPEAGTFTIQVDAVSRVWENSRAENPRSIVGKTVSIGGVFGRFLDVLVVTRVGETVEFECKFDDGGLRFPGELLRKVGAYKPEEYPILPDAFRGFRGLVAAEVISKDSETFEMVLRVDQVRKTWDGNEARDPKSIEGKTVSLIGFWNRREVFHEMKVGSKIEVGMRHKTPASDHLDVVEDVRILEGRSVRSGSGEMRKMERDRMQGGSERGFRGMLVGRLVEKDVERGTFTVTVDAVPRVWENNEFDNPKSLIGKNVAIEGVGGRLIDALVVARNGETLEFGALYEGGERLHVGEVLHKVAPVKPGDYPVLPEEFRGFRGVVTAKIIRKSDELHEFVVEVEKIEELFDGNQAEQPRSIVGKQLLLGGFWNRQDAFHDLKVGDRIRCGMIHRQVLSDHLDAVEVLQKLDVR